MKISIYNKKGGVGKTSLAFSLAKDLDYFLISNDDSVIEMAYPNKSKIMEKPKLIDNCVYDFGGFVDTNIIEIINASDFVIIPLTSDLNSFKKTVSTVEELENKNIIFVASKSEKEDFKEIEAYLEKKYSHPIFEVRSSRIWAKTFSRHMSVSEIKNENKVSSYIYRNSITGYQQLLNYIKNKDRKSVV